VCKNKQRQSYEPEEGHAAAALGQEMADKDNVSGDLHRDARQQSNATRLG